MNAATRSSRIAPLSLEPSRCFSNRPVVWITRPQQTGKPAAAHSPRLRARDGGWAADVARTASLGRPRASADRSDPGNPHLQLGRRRIDRIARCVGRCAAHRPRNPSRLPGGSPAAPGKGNSVSYSKTALLILRSGGFAAAGLAGLIFGGVFPAHGENVKRLTEPLGVSLGLGDVIDRATIAIGDRFDSERKDFDALTLVLTLEEERTSGQLISLGEFQTLIGDTTLVTTAGPQGRWVVQMTMSTAPIAAGSVVNACVSTIEHTQKGDVLGPAECREFTPPFF